MIVAVLGSGTMGQGIAQLAATSGYETRVFDVDHARAGAAVEAIGAQLEKLVQKSKMTNDDKTRALGRLSIAKDLHAACAEVDYVIESVPEDMNLKAEIFRRVKDAAPVSAVLGSNTSSLSITELGAKSSAADRVIGLHFFNPPPVMELLEVVRGLGTSQPTVDKALALAAQMKKTPIVVADAPGFASSRLGVILGAEAIRMLEAGVASAKDIDRAMELGYRHPMGPLKLTDLVGLDVRLAILEHLHREVGEQFRPPVLLRKMVRAGKLGKKTGEGFYVWKDGQPT